MKKQILLVLVLTGSFCALAKQALQPQKSIGEVYEEELSRHPNGGASNLIVALKAHGYLQDAQAWEDAQKNHLDHLKKLANKGFIERLSIKLEEHLLAGKMYHSLLGPISQEGHNALRVVCGTSFASYPLLGERKSYATYNDPHERYFVIKKWLKN